MSRHLFGWSYPPGAENDPNAPWNQKECPESCASMVEVWSECGGVDACECFGPAPWSWPNRWLELYKHGVAECRPVVKECDCPSPEDIKAERAEAKAEARAERKLWED